MPSLFRRRSAELVDEADPAPDADPAPEADTATVATVADEVTEPAEAQRSRGYTPSKKELGVSTPRRPSTHVRRPGVTAAPTSRNKMTKEERHELRQERRRRRQEVTEGMRRGDERFLTARDKGPVRALARDIVDSRRTVGTWFFGGALLVLLGSSAAMPPMVRLGANVLFALLAVAVILDCTLVCRKVRRLVRERHPDTTERMRSLYFYIVMRSITFRRLRIPLPRRKVGDSV